MSWRRLDAFCLGALITALATMSWEQPADTPPQPASVAGAQGVQRAWCEDKLAEHGRELERLGRVINNALEGQAALRERVLMLGVDFYSVYPPKE